MSVLTRAGRKKAGLESPTPFFTRSSKPKDSVSSSPPPCKVTTPYKKGPRQRSSYRQPLPPHNSAAAINKDVNSEQIIWIQCDSCKKWRKIRNNSSVDTGKEWYCHMNASPGHNSCSSTEEDCHRLPKGLIYAFKGLVPGQLVWAKLQSYPPWPAIVTPDPFTDNNHIEEVMAAESNGEREEESNGCIYHVEFLGKHRTHSWLPEEMATLRPEAQCLIVLNVEPYRCGHCSLGRILTSRTSKISAKLREAIDEANSIQEFSNTERLGKCQYIPGKIGRGKLKVGNKPNPKGKKLVKINEAHPFTNPLSTNLTDSNPKGTLPLPTIVPSPTLPTGPLYSDTATKHMVPSVNTPMDMAPVVMATGLQVLQMFGITIDKDTLAAAGCHGNNIPPTNGTMSSQSKLTPSLYNITSITNRENTNNGGERTNNMSNKSSSSLCVISANNSIPTAITTGNRLSSLGACPQREVKKPSARGRGRKPRLPKLAIGTRIVTPQSSNIKQYFKPTSNGGGNELPLPTVYDTSDYDTSTDLQLAPPTDDVILDQVVPENTQSLDTLTLEVMNDLTDMENLLDMWDTNRQTNLSLTQQHNTMRDQTAIDNSSNLPRPPTPPCDNEIQSLLDELQDLEESIGVF